MRLYVSTILIEFVETDNLIMKGLQNFKIMLMMKKIFKEKSFILFKTQEREEAKKQSAVNIGDKKVDSLLQQR